MSDHWGTPPQPEPAEILSNRPGTFLPDLPPVRARGHRKWLAAGIGIVIVAGLGAGVAYAAGALRGGGEQPDAVIPSTAVAYAAVDLDPSLGQKVDALRFLRKFPSAKASLGSTDDFRQYFFDELAKGNPLSALSYDKDVRPWIGNRFAVAVVPGTSTSPVPNALVVIQVSDAAKAKVGLKKLTSGLDGGTCSISDGYAVCAQTPAILNAAQAATRTESLAHNPTFTADVSSAGDRGIAVAWADLARLGQLVPAASGLGGMTGVSSVGTGATKGRFVAVLRFAGADLRLTGRVAGGTPDPSAPHGGTGVDQLPAGTALAFGASTSPGAIAKSYQQLEHQLSAAGGSGLLTGLHQNLHQLGLTLPQDLSALLGTRFAVAFGGVRAGGPEIGLRSNAPESAAGPVLNRVNAALRQAGDPIVLHHAGSSSGYAVALDPAYAEQLTAKGGLGAAPAFRAAAPGAASATVVLYLNVDQLTKGQSLALLGEQSGPTKANLGALSAIGLTARSGTDGTSTFQVNVVTR
jgi:hypothetical protein